MPKQDYQTIRQALNEAISLLVLNGVYNTNNSAYASVMKKAKQKVKPIKP